MMAKSSGTDTISIGGARGAGRDTGLVGTKSCWATDVTNLTKVVVVVRTSSLALRSEGIGTNRARTNTFAIVLILIRRTCA